MEGGIPLRDFVQGQHAAVPVAAGPPQRYAPLEVEPVGSFMHGMQRTLLSESTWRLLIGGLAVAVALFLFAVGVIVFLGFSENRSLASYEHRSSGFANKCTSSGWFSVVASSCKVIKSLPLNVSENAACYRLARDLVWTGETGDGYAIEWWGNHGEFHGCGHRIISTAVTSQVILVHGSFADDADNSAPTGGLGGQLTAYDLYLESAEQQYVFTSYGIRAQYGATLTLEDAVLHNFHIAVDVASATLAARGLNVTATLSLDDEMRGIALDELGWAVDAWGVNCYGGVNCGVEDYTFHATNDSASGDYRANPFVLTSVALRCGYSPNVDSVLSGPGFCRLERAQLTCTQCISVDDASSLILRDIQVAVLASGANQYSDTWFGPISTPLNSPIGVNIGVLVNTYLPSSAIIERVSVDTRNLDNNTSFNGAMYISSGTGMVIKDVTLYGVAPQAAWYTAFVVSPGYTQVQQGMLAIDTTISIDEPISPVQISRMTIRMLDEESYGVTLGTARFVDNNYITCSSGMITASFDDCSFIGGSIGVFIGSGSKHQVAVRRSQFARSYYGVFMSNSSKNALFDGNFHSTHECEAIHVEANAQRAILRDVSYSENRYDLINHGSLVVQVSSATTGPLLNSCPSVPLIYNFDGNACVAPSALEDDRRSRLLAEVRARMFPE